MLSHEISPTPDSVACNNHLVGELYYNYHGWLSNWLRCRVGCNEMAADLAQDTFLRILTRSQPLACAHSAKGLLRTIANGLCIDMWRKRAIQQAWLDTLASRPNDVEISAEDQTIIIETLCEIDEMLSRLPKNVASAFIWSQIDGLTYKQIAVKLEVSERTVKNYMAKAMLECVLIESNFNNATL